MYCFLFTSKTASENIISKSLKINFRRMEQKLLIVDDEAHIRMLLEQTLEELEDEGVSFFSAENGEEALEIIQTENPQLVFLDVMMPKINGMELCCRVTKE